MFVINGEERLIYGGKNNLKDPKQKFKRLTANASCMIYKFVFNLSSKYIY